MASLFSPSPTAATTFHQDPNLICYSPLRPISKSYYFWSCTNHSKRNNTITCSSFVDEISVSLDNSLSQFPVFQSGYAQFEKFTGELPEEQKLGLLIFAGITWIYLTARPGVLLGAIDAYILAPIQLGLDSLSGKRNFKMKDFLIGERLGEGSFGIVYSGVIVPKNVNLDDIVRKRGSSVKSVITDSRFKEKVILKQVKIGVQGAAECGEFEEWFNYRLSRAAPETCADFLGSFVAEKTNSRYTKGEKWLVWKFEELHVTGRSGPR
uniref:Protein kinase domain-containing protein n=1 Tax=Solanum tuberosum TaxID=4113 RepID=M1AFI3_SOLTU